MAQLDTGLLAQTNTLAPAPSLEQKLDAYAEFLQQVLATHDAAFTTARVATHFEEAVVPSARDRAGRIAVMGDPARYAEIAWEGSAGNYEEFADGAVLQVEHRLRVYVYYGIRDGATGGQTRAQAAESFRALMESRTAPYGLLHAMRTQGYLIVGGLGTGGEEIGMGQPENVEAAFVAVDKQNKEYRHEATFTITLA